MEATTLPRPDRALAEPNTEVLGFRTRCHALPAVLAGTHSPSWTPPSCQTSQAHPKKGPPVPARAQLCPQLRAQRQQGQKGAARQRWAPGWSPSRLLKSQSRESRLAQAGGIHRTLCHDDPQNHAALC